MAGPERPLIGNLSGEKSRLLSAIAAAFRGEKMADDNLLPAIVESYDRVNNVAKVKPQIQWVDVNEGTHSRAPISNVSVLSLGGGGFHISFPIGAGDLGWIFASDRDISLFKQSLTESPPNTGRLHKFEDALFVPDVFRKYTVAEEDAGRMVIQSTSGNTKISIGESSISIATESAVSIKAPSSFTVDTPSAITTSNLSAGNGTTGTFGTTTGQTVTVQAGIVTNIS